VSSQTEQTTVPGVAEQGSHHFLITLQRPTGSGFGTADWSGTWTPPPGTTRADGYARIRADIAAAHPEFAQANVVFFTLEPNRL
jgi:hypothetical protein